MNPCECCECSIGQGARATAIVSIIINTIFMVHCFVSVLEVTGKSTEKLSNLHSQGAETIRRNNVAYDRSQDYFLGIPISTPQNEIIITIAILLLSSLRLAFSTLFFVGVQKKRNSFIYPWILSTMVDLVALFALVVIMGKIVFGEDSFNAFEGRKIAQTVQEEDISMQAAVMIVALLTLLIIFAYFLWVASAFISENRTNVLIAENLAYPINEEAMTVGMNQMQVITQRPRRHNRVSPPACRPGGDSLPFYGEANARRYEPLGECAPPTYEEAIKMPRLSRQLECLPGSSENTII